MALKRLPDELSIVMDEDNSGVSLKFVGSKQAVLLLWLMLSAQVSKKLQMPLSVMSAMMVSTAPNIDKQMFKNSKLCVDIKIPDEGG